MSLFSNACSHAQCNAMDTTIPIQPFLKCPPLRRKNWAPVSQHDTIITLASLLSHPVTQSLSYSVTHPLHRTVLPCTCPHTFLHLCASRCPAREACRLPTPPRQKGGCEQRKDRTRNDVKAKPNKEYDHQHSCKNTLNLICICICICLHTGRSDITTN